MSPKAGSAGSTAPAPGSQGEQLLKSLKYDSMDERRDSLRASNGSSFKWIFKSEENEATEDEQDSSKAAEEPVASENEAGEPENSAEGADDGEIAQEGEDEKMGEKDANDAEDKEEEAVKEEEDEDDDDDMDYSDEYQDEEQDDDETEESDLEPREQWGIEPSDNLSAWLKSDSSIYWISGKAGSGKSTLMKFLLEADETGAALESRAPNTAILSHFFWKPGSRMQKSIKGMLCSFLHQALSANPEARELVLSSFGAAVEPKLTEADWSVEELRTICMAVLGAYPQPLCLFIDGLDELGEEDSWPELLKIVDELSAMQNVKLCVSSRAEPLLKEHLGRHPHMRLQDLTASDMYKYAKIQLKPLFKARQAEPEALKSLARKLVFRAEGVFLWLYLVINRLKAAAESDPADDLSERLERLPGGVFALYKDMWDRLNENTPKNQVAAARYFNLVISNTRLMDASWVTFANHYFYDLTSSDLSVLHMVASIDKEIQSALLEDATAVPQALGRRISEACRNTLKDIESKCAGLLEVASGPNHELSFLSMLSDRLSAPVGNNDMVEFSYRRIDFIHRSAYDFMTDTPEGLQIRDCDPSSEDERWLDITKGFLGLAQTGQLGVKGHVNRALTPLSKLAAPGLQAERSQIFSLCHRWYRRGILSLLDGMESRYGQKPKGLNPPFLVIAAHTQFRDFVLSAISKSPDASAEATSVLRNLSDRFTLSEDIFTTTHRYVGPLLELGADPNEKAVIRRKRYSKALFKDAVPFESAFGRFLNECVQNDHYHRKSPPGRLEEVVRSFMSKEPNMNDRTSICVQICANRAETGHRSSMDNPDEFETSSTHHSNSNEVADDVCFIVNANLAFMLDVLGRRTASIYAESGLGPARGSPGFPTSEVEPHCQIMFALFRTSKTRKRYRVLDEEVSANIAQVLEPWLCGDHSDAVLAGMDDMVQNVLSTIGDHSHYEEVDSMGSYLVQAECGYSIISDDQLAQLASVLE